MSMSIDSQAQRSPDEERRDGGQYNILHEDQEKNQLYNQDLKEVPSYQTMQDYQ